MAVSTFSTSQEKKKTKRKKMIEVAFRVRVLLLCSKKVLYENLCLRVGQEKLANFVFSTGR
jgi:hypothetical protein